MNRIRFSMLAVLAIFINGVCYADTYTVDDNGSEGYKQIANAEPNHFLINPYGVRDIDGKFIVWESKGESKGDSHNPVRHSFCVYLITHHRRHCLHNKSKCF